MMTRIRVRGPNGDVDRSVHHGPGAARLTHGYIGGLPVGHMTDTADVAGASWRHWDTPRPRVQPTTTRREAA